MQFAALNQPFTSPESRLVGAEADYEPGELGSSVRLWQRGEEGDPGLYRDIRTPASRVLEPGVNEAAYQTWLGRNVRGDLPPGVFEDIRQALAELLRGTPDLPSGQEQLPVPIPGEGGPISMARPSDETQHNLDQITRQNPWLSNFVATRPVDAFGGTQLPGPADQAALQRVMRNEPPAPVPQTAVPGATGMPTAEPPMTTPMIPEWLRGLEGANIGPSQATGAAGGFLDALRHTMPLQYLVENLGPMGPMQPGPAVPGGAPAPVPVVGAAMMTDLPVKLAELIASAVGGVPEAVRDPGNQPVYGMTEMGPMPFGTQGAFEGARDAVGELLRMLGVPGFEGY